jgi:hypothetical protein
MSKGVNALEIIFGLFVLVIVVLVVIRMFSRNVNVDPIVRELEQVQQQYDYEQAELKCSNLCSEYQLSNCDPAKAMNFCTQLVEIDLDGNNQPGEASTGVQQHGAIVAGVPYCEDGFYCFHVMSTCKCGSVTLGPDTCDALMCDYLMTQSYLTEDESKSYIKKQINTGTCSISTTDLEEYSFLDRDTIMGSGKNWFDIFGMGDCQIGLPTQIDTHSLSFSACTIVVGENGSGIYDCDLLTKKGSCNSGATVAIADTDGNAAIALPEVGMGTIELTDTKLSGTFVSPDAELMLSPDSVCEVLTYTCDDPDTTAIALQTQCTIQSA